MAAAVPELVAIAEAFALPGPVTVIAPLGNGNVNGSTPRCLPSRSS